MIILSILFSYITFQLSLIPGIISGIVTGLWYSIKDYFMALKKEIRNPVIRVVQIVIVISFFVMIIATVIGLLVTQIYYIYF